MAQINSDIYFQQQVPDLLGAYERGSKLGDLMRARKKEQAVQEAYKSGLTQNPDGSVSFDGKKTLRSLMEGGHSNEAWDLQEKQNAQMAAEQKRAKEKQMAELEEITRSAWKVNDQNSYDAELKNLASKGIDVSKFSPQYNPQMIEQFKMQTLSVKERLDHSLKERELALKNREEKSKSNNGAGDGWKKVNADYAKDYNDFTGGGETKATDAIQKLKDYKTKLENESKSFFSAGGGPISGSLPDAFRTQESISLRDNIRSVANSALKATFGGALSDGERIALANEFYNDKLDAKQNLEIVERKIAELENGLKTQKERAKYFEQNKGNLAGFQSGLPNDYKTPGGGAGKTQNLAQNKPSWAK